MQSQSNRGNRGRNRGNWPGTTELGISGNTGTTYQNNPSEGAIIGINRIKEQHDSVKLQNGEVMLKND